MVSNYKSEPIFVGIDNEVIELTGVAKDAFLLDRKAIKEEHRLIEAETTAKAEAKESGMAKLRKLGLTDDEIAGLIS